MPRISEIARSGSTRMGKAILAAGGDLEEMAKHVNAVKMLDERFEDWTDKHPSLYRLMTTLWDNFCLYYERIYCGLYIYATRSAHPLDDITWDVAGVDEMFKRLTHYLTWCLDNTPGKYGEKYVGAFTFRPWVSCMICLVISELRQMDRNLGVLISGWTQKGSDGLYSRLFSWARSTADALQLRRKPKKRKAYGKAEASLLITSLLEKADKAHFWESTLQKVCLVQTLLNTGLRPGELCRSDDHKGFLRLCDVEIRRDVTSNACYEWHVVLHLENWKGGHDPLARQDEQRMTLHACKLTQNLQFEVATVLVPWMIHRNGIAEIDAAGKAKRIDDLEQFFRSEAVVFRGIGNRPLFCKSAGQEIQHDSALNVSSLDEQLARLYTLVGLPGSGAYHFRYHKGDKIRILFGASAQAEVLHHKTYGKASDIGYLHYSSGMDVHPVNRVMLDEGLSSAETEKLHRAGYYFRQQMSDAMMTLVRKAAGGTHLEDFGETTKSSKGFRANPESLAKRLEGDGEYQQLMGDLERFFDMLNQARAALRRDPTNVALQGQVNAIENGLIQAKRRSRRRKKLLQDLLVKEQVSKYRQRLRTLGIGGTREEFAQAHKQLLGIDAMEHVSSAADILAGAQAVHFSAKSVPSVNSFFQKGSAADRVTEKGISLELGPEGSEDEEQDEEEDEEQGEEEDEEGGPGSIDAEGEKVDPNVELAGLSLDVEVSRIAIMRFYYGRLKAKERLLRIAELHRESGFCGFCPAEQAGLKRIPPKSHAGSKYPIGGPLLNKVAEARFVLNKAPARSSKFKHRAEQHLQNAHPLQYAAITAGGPIPPMHFELFDREDDDKLAELISDCFDLEEEAPEIDIDLEKDVEAFGDLLQEAVTHRSYHDCI